MFAAIVISALVLSVVYADSCPACTLAQCATVQCGGDAPYSCLTGQSAGGCSSNPSAWNNTVTCTSCCDASQCSDMPRFQCNATCSAAMCHSVRRCAASAPYMCTAGNGTYGCSVSSSYWPLMPQCDACCDIRSCEETCSSCTAAQCQTNPCTTAIPYMCTSGPLNGTCSASSSYFGHESQCFTCCDSASCGSSRFSCDANPCPAEVCHSTARCSLTTGNYQCTAGSAANGCSNSSSYWPAFPSCNNCCNVQSCEFSCPPCSSEQCISNPCTPWDPYICTAGPLSNGCSGDPKYFGKQSQCYACCDSSACSSQLKK
ncbi:Hypothetical protein, putative [Bodo saltans]|uniref:Membrane-associated protein n=1 Tax=Bodo saltans TaxID=75058 RepID=A0A0S4J3X2_BODSA|nr:Hypothetical protein, putative [Bodo saltans]|eukprot:CUG72152.1 Hypothetical protein, putative [Bodo saltans]